MKQTSRPRPIRYSDTSRAAYSAPPTQVGSRQQLLISGRRRYSLLLLAICAALMTILVHTPSNVSAVLNSQTSAVGHVVLPFGHKPIERTTRYGRRINPAAPCANGSIFTVVAHEDDDILFMNPAIQAAINAKMCVTTVYLTAGDDGQGQSYWMAREHGPDAAYAFMAGLPDTWQERPAVVNGHVIMSHTLDGSQRIRLYFLRLPDGNVDGQGFAATDYASLEKLHDASISSLQPLDGSAAYTQPDLITTLAGLLVSAKPTLINTQAYENPLTPQDHTDHQLTGWLTDRARRQADLTTPIRHYLGYELNALAPDLMPDQILRKQAIFNVYERTDSLICNSETGCRNESTYGNYFSRQYLQQPQSTTGPGV